MRWAFLASPLAMAVMVGAAMAQTYKPHAIGQPSVVGNNLQQSLDDGTVASTPLSGLSGYASQASVSAISGSITHAGRTTSPTTLSFATVSTGGSVATMAAADSKSGPAQIGDECNVASATATPLPATMRFTCAITTAGIASITAFPTLGVGLGAQSVSVNVFWRG